MRHGFRQAMALLHSWAGLVPGWLLFAVFLTGSLSYFRPEISQWTRPELPSGAMSDPGRDVRAAQDYLTRTAPDATRWLIEMPLARLPLTGVTLWRERGAGPHYRHDLLDPRQGMPIAARATHGGDFFYYFHFDLHMPWRLGRLIVGFSAMAMLVALLTGLIVHRRLFADFFTFRPGKGPRSWLDAHNACGVLALPYHVMITYSGLVILMSLYLPWGIDLLYGTDRARFFAEAGQNFRPPPAAGVPAGLVDLASLMPEAARRWPGEAVGRIDVYGPGDAAARVVFTVADDARLSHARARLIFDGVGGTLLSEPENGLPGPARLERALYGMHLGRFGGPLLHALFFCSGLLGAAMVGAGLILWTGKRRAAGETHPVAEALNLAVIGGLPIAIAAFFWANRLLPVGLAARADREGLCFFAAWMVAGIHAALHRDAAAWRTQFRCAAGLFLALPVLDGLTTSHGLPVSLPAGDWLFAGFDLAFLAGGGGMAGLSLLSRRNRRRVAK
ncbi:PepSY-associated TM helix domain-containing protein [Telmatospirillum siberiense]|uniref:Peptidase n=1 Tax=Telmatospirillum siberiense TaxID=382514 RepID=A0A2N3Q063_9PROT|nr:PepSY-associated TM helix domain-containing protein [Telmatospirillum siberiense]PKU26044.1 peptidase [Telmatospirillum siberiense]